MDSKKIGKFIQNLRLDLNMTQKELADKLYITDKAVSKWETGNSVPDISILEKLSKILKVSVTELINGEKILDSNFKNTDEVIVSNLYSSKKKCKKRNKIIIILSIVLILFILLILGIFFYNNYNKIIVYKFTGESQNFSFYNGSIVYSKEGNILNTGIFCIKNDSKIDTTKIKDAEIFISFENGGGILGSKYSNNSNIEFLDWLGNISFYKSNFKTDMVGNEFGILEPFKFPSNIKVIISYLDIDNNFIQETFKIKYNILASSRLFG